MVSSISKPTGGSSSKISGGKEGEQGKKGGKSSAKSGKEALSTICLTIYVFRGLPDAYHNRHVLIYFTSPENPDLHETVHVQRPDNRSPWAVDRIHKSVKWDMSRTYLSHVNAGAVQVTRGQEMLPIDIVADTPVEGQEQSSDWNCQHFVFEGLQRLVSYGLETEEWYDYVEGELMNQLLEGTVG